MDYLFYTNSTASIDAGSNARLAYKKAGSTSVIVDASNGAFTFQTGTTPGIYQFHLYDSAGTVTGTGEFEIRQDIATAAQSFDPRSEAEKTLEALEARIAGRALTIQQASVTIDGRSIQYINSIDELLKWRDYFARIVAREHGHADASNMVCRLTR